jgi:hypothetical protein
VQVVAVGILEFTLGEVFAGLRPAACYGAQLAVGVPLGLSVAKHFQQRRAARQTAYFLVLID